MDEKKVDVLKLFIKLYRQAKNKEAFIDSWDELLNTKGTEITLADVYDAAYGEAIAQVLANEEELYG
jgi:hypothetical protein